MRKWLSRNLIILTLVSLAQDAASELLYPLLPYIVTAGVIGASPFALGLIEGCAEAAAGFTKLYSGKKSDTLGRKPFVIAGYSIAGLGKALVIFGTVWSTIFLGRVTDRIGKGLRSAPRDALIHDSVPSKDVGKAFGFHRTGDNIGAVIGPLLALAGLSLLNGDVRAVAKWALIPAFISAVLTFFPHPRMVLQKNSDIKLINTLSEKKQLLENIGLDYFVVEPFTYEFSRLSALEYVRDILVTQLKAKKIIIGYDHRFGRNRNADIQDLKKYGSVWFVKSRTKRY